MGLVGEQLASLGFTRLVISPLQRCLETAKQLNVKLQLPYSSWQIDSEVCEASECVVITFNFNPAALAIGLMTCFQGSGAATCHFLSRFQPFDDAGAQPKNVSGISATAAGGSCKGLDVGSEQLAGSARPGRRRRMYIASN